MLIVKFKDPWDLKSHRALGHAILAAGARHGTGILAGRVKVGCSKECCYILIAKQLFLIEEGDILFQLFKVGHSGKDHRYSRHGLYERESPVCRCPVRIALGQQLFSAEAGLCQLASAQRFHDPDRYADVVELFDLVLGVLEFKVEIVELYLAELEMSEMLHDETVHHIEASVAGESQMTDLPFLLLLHQQVVDPKLRVQIRIDIRLVYIVEQIEAEIACEALRDDLSDENGAIDKSYYNALKNALEANTEALRGIDKRGAEIAFALGRVAVYLESTANAHAETKLP